MYVVQVQAVKAPATADRAIRPADMAVGGGDQVTLGPVLLELLRHLLGDAFEAFGIELVNFG
jgi:hypothetical protein